MDYPHPTLHEAWPAWQLGAIWLIALLLIFVVEAGSTADVRKASSVRLNRNALMYLRH